MNTQLSAQGAPGFIATPESYPGQSGDMVDVQEYLAIFMRRRWLMLLTLSTIFVLGMLWTMTRRPIYESTTQIVVATSSGGAFSGGSDSPLISGLEALTKNRSIETQVEIIQGEDLLNDAYKSLDLATRTEGFRSDDLPRWSYRVASKKDTDVITVTGRAYTPEAAANFANSIAKTYIAKDLSNNKASTHKACNYASAQMRRVEKLLDKASATLSRFKRRTGIIAPDSQFGKAAELIATMEMDSDAAKTDIASSRQQVRSLESELRKQEPNIQSSKTVAINPAFTEAVANLGKLNAQRTALLVEYTPQSKEIQAIDTQIRDAEKQVRKTTEMIVSAKVEGRNLVHDELLGEYAKSIAQSAVSGARAKALDKVLAHRYRQMDALPDQERQLTKLMQDVAMLRGTYEMLSQKYYALLLSENAMLPSGQVFSGAHRAESPSYPSRTRNAMLFLMLGAMCAAGIAVMVERLDVRLHDQSTVERLTHAATLSMIPEIPDDMPKLISEAGQNSLLLESYRILRNNISFSSIDRETKILAMSSPGRGEGKSTTSANLAIAMAMDGKRVLLMDCDLRRPSQHKVFKVSRDIGFTNVLTGVCKVEDAIIKTNVENLWLLPSGPIPPNPSEILNSEHSREFFNSLRDKYDLIIVDCPPCTGLSDVQVVATIADALLLLVCMDRTLKPHLHMALRTLSQVDAPLIGTVINRMELRRQGYYSYYNYYYYSYDYTADDHQERRVKRTKHRRKLPKP